MKRLYFCLLAMLLAFALPAMAEEPAHDTLELSTGDNSAAFDVFPGTIGVNGTANPVLVVADADGNLEMVCVKMSDDIGVSVRKEGSRQYDSHSQPLYTSNDLLRALDFGDPQQLE